MRRSDPRQLLATYTGCMVMPKHGTPEPRFVEFGAEIARLRTRRVWSRTDFVNEVHRRLPDNHPLRQRISNDWLRYVEEGRRVNLSRAHIFGLAEVAADTEEAFVKLVMLADRNILSDDNGTISSTGIGLTYMMSRLYANPVLRPVLDDLFANATGAAVSDQDVGEILQTLGHALMLNTSVPQPSATPPKPTGSKEPL